MGNSKYRVGTVIRDGRALGVYRDPETGLEYATRRLLQMAIRRRNTTLLIEFERMVADRTLGQDPWERLPMESEVMFARFREYLTMVRDLNLGPRPANGAPMQTRSTARLAEKLGLQPRATSNHALRFHWALRAKCWDREMERQIDEEFREEKKNAARKQARLGSKLQEAALRGAENIIATGCVDMTPNDVARFADVGVKIERLAHDKSTSNEAQSTRTVFVYEGGRPKWADADSDVKAEHQVVDGDAPAGNQTPGTLVRQLEAVTDARD